MTACTNCAAKLRSDVTFCVSCGASQRRRERKNEGAASTTPGECSRCGAELSPGERICTSCREEMALPELARPGHGDEGMTRGRIRSSETDCVICNRRRLSLLGLTKDSWGRCRCCRVYYCGGCAGRLRTKQGGRWWIPRLGSDKRCIQCSGGVPEPVRWYHLGI